MTWAYKWTLQKKRNYNELVQVHLKCHHLSKNDHMPAYRIYSLLGCLLCNNSHLCVIGIIVYRSIKDACLIKPWIKPLSCLSKKFKGSRVCAAGETSRHSSFRSVVPNSTQDLDLKNSNIFMLNVLDKISAVTLWFDIPQIHEANIYHDWQIHLICSEFANSPNKKYNKNTFRVEFAATFTQNVTRK